jgi:hypothetical protein
MAWTVLFTVTAAIHKMCCWSAETAAPAFTRATTAGPSQLEDLSLIFKGNVS